MGDREREIERQKEQERKEKEGGSIFKTKILLRRNQEIDQILQAHLGTPPVFLRESFLLILSWEILKYSHFLRTEPFRFGCSEFPFFNPPSYGLQLPFLPQLLSQIFSFTSATLWEGQKKKKSKNVHFSSLRNIYSATYIWKKLSIQLIEIWCPAFQELTI